MSGQIIVEPLPGYKDIKPFVYAGFFPVSNEDYQDLKDAIEKLSLSGVYPQLLQATFTGNVLLRGGDLRIEGSVVTLVVSMGILGMFFALRHTSSIPTIAFWLPRSTSL